MEIKVKTKTHPDTEKRYSYDEMIARRGIYRVANTRAWPATRFIIGDGLAIVVSSDEDDEELDSEVHPSRLEKEDWGDWTFVEVLVGSITITWSAR